MIDYKQNLPDYNPVQDKEEEKCGCFNQYIQKVKEPETKDYFIEDSLNMGAQFSRFIRSRFFGSRYNPTLGRERGSYNRRSTLCHNDFKNPARLHILLDKPPVSQEIQEKHAWNPSDCSSNIIVKTNDKLTLYRYPVAQRTDCCRSKVGYSKGLHIFEFGWKAHKRGTHAVVGVGTKNAPLDCLGYKSLLGSNEESWGWDILRHRLLHNSQTPTDKATPYPITHRNVYGEEVPDFFQLVLDMDMGNMSFIVNGQYLGVAFSGLKGKTLYLMVNSVWGHSEISLQYINGLDPQPLSLVDLCTDEIRHAVCQKQTVADLPIPNVLKDYILYQPKGYLINNNEISNNNEKKLREMVIDITSVR